MIELKSELKKLDLEAKGQIHRNLDIDVLLQKAVERNEGVLNRSGALTVKTGKYTGRSPNDRFIVDSPNVHEDINWGKVNVPLSEEKFNLLYKKIINYLSQKEEIFIFDGFAGADKKYTLPVRVINEQAYQNLFIRHMLRRPTAQELEEHTPNLTVIAAPGCMADPEIHGTRSETFIVLHLEKRIILIGGTQYCGEIKKSIFTVLNYHLPKNGVLSMHCSANIGEKNDVVLFFGLSGTGKTTLSMDPSRRLIGDDETCWSEKGIFNIEGGVYAKCINLTREREPLIYDAMKRGSVVENVVMDPQTREYYFADASITENTRAAFPMEFVSKAERSGIGDHPQTIIFLTADAFGVLPPITRLNTEQAIYHFVSGYTSKLAGTERGIIEPQATFSSLFGEPFMPLKPIVYASLLRDRINRYKPRIFFINTGWSGGSYGVGERIKIKDTRRMVTAVLSGELDNVEYRHDDIFNLDVPQTCPGVDAKMLNPINTWLDKNEYIKKAKELATMFNKNFAKYNNIPDEVINAGPRPSP